MAPTGTGERLTLVGRYIDEQAIAVGSNPLVLKVGQRVTVSPESRGWTPVVRPRREEGVNVAA